MDLGSINVSGPDGRSVDVYTYGGKPLCDHLGAVEVRTVWDDELVAYWCEACETQLSPDFLLVLTAAAEAKEVTRQNLLLMIRTSYNPNERANLWNQYHALDG